MLKCSLAFRIAAALVLVVACAGDAHGESFNQRVKKANRQIMQGDPDGALSMFRDLQTDDPESALLHYGQGCAQYKQGEQEFESPSPEHAIEAFKSARESFAKASLSSDEQIRRRAQFNGALTATQLAVLSAKTGDSKAATEAFKAAIEQYEELIRRNPGDSAARTNLNHTRYLLKKLLQDPPKPQEQKQDGQGKQDQQQKESGQEQDSGKEEQGQSAEGEKKDQQGDQGQNQDPQRQAEAQQQDEGIKKDSDKESERKDKDQSSESEKKQKLAQAKQSDNQQQSPNQSSAQQDDKQQPDRQSIEAILDSLENQDNREQRQRQSMHGDVRMRRDWW